MLKCKTNKKFRNWDRSLIAKPASYCEPESQPAVEELVKEVAARGGHIRVAGSGHSWSPLVPTDDTMVSLGKLDELVSVSPDKRVRVEAGIRYKALIDDLREKTVKLGLENTGSIAEQTVAGGVSTATHGTGLGIGSLSTQVEALTLVDGRAQPIQWNERNNPEEMAAARVSMGMLGIITDVTLRCVDLYDLDFTAYWCKLDDIIDDLPNLAREYTRLRLYWLVWKIGNQDGVIAMTMNPPGSPEGTLGRASGSSSSTTPGSSRPTFALIKDPGSLVRQVSKFKDGENRCRRLIRIRERYDKALTITMPPRHDECEYAVSVANCVRAIKDFRAVIQQESYTLDLPVEIRFVAKDEYLLSPAYESDVCYIGAYTNRKDAEEIFPKFEKVMKSHGGRPHWGKYFTLSRAEARNMYPKFDRFCEIRERMDPQGVFLNQLTESLFR